MLRPPPCNGARSIPSRALHLEVLEDRARVIQGTLHPQGCKRMDATLIPCAAHERCIAIEDAFGALVMCNEDEGRGGHNARAQQVIWPRGQPLYNDGVAAVNALAHVV